MKLTLIAAALGGLLATSAIADDNRITVDQVGDDNVVGLVGIPVVQAGMRNNADLNQNGYNNRIGANGKVVWQEGQDHSLRVNQNGDYNNVRMIYQEGQRNRILINQNNDHNLVEAQQYDQDQFLRVTQTGYTNKSFTQQGR